MGCMLSFSFLFYDDCVFLSLFSFHVFPIYVLTGTFEDDPVDEDDRSDVPSGAGFEDPSA